MKRASDVVARADNTTLPRSNAPLFERYQFLSPGNFARMSHDEKKGSNRYLGLFMGLLTTLLLISILAVGINAVASLQVSYAAFDKEMGPAANKK
jgi:hypothetical protein